MSLERTDELVGRLLDGDLPPADQRELAAHLRADAAARRQALDLWQQESRIRRLLLGPADTAATAQQVQARIRAETPSSTELANGVLDNIRRIETTARMPHAKRRRPYRIPEGRVPGRHGEEYARGSARRVRRRAWLALAAALLVAVGLYRYQQGLLVLPGQEHAWLAGGPGVSVRRGQRQIQTTRNTPLLSGDEIAVAQGCRASVRYPREATSLDLAENSRAVLYEQDGKRIRLEAGRLAASVAPQPAGRELVLVTAHASVTVKGTRLEIERLPDRTRVDVREGTVEVVCAATGESALVHGGQYALAAASLAVVGQPVYQHRTATLPERVRAGLVLLYTFQEGRGDLVRDVSGAGRPLDLRIGDVSAVRWVSGGGLITERATIILAPEPAHKLIEACRASNELTIEAWVTPHHLIHPFAEVTEKHWPRRIVTLSADTGKWNFVFGQGSVPERPKGYVTRVQPPPWAGPAPEDRATYQMTTPQETLRTRLTHVVFTRDRQLVGAMYVNGAEQDKRPLGGHFAGWGREYRFALANELVEDRSWLGTYHLIAVYSRALSADEVARNFRAGPGGKRQSVRR
ncbi:MAG: FecR domain-containing protein [Kiritimatiellae bacterium]|nr:FecR domain-containing protein [Kiritimatiellia bacterium]